MKERRSMAGLVRGTILALAFTALAAATGCHSYHIDATVENRTGSPIQLLEVD